MTELSLPSLEFWRGGTERFNPLIMWLDFLETTPHPKAGWHSLESHPLRIAKTVLPLRKLRIFETVPGAKTKYLLFVCLFLFYLGSKRSRVWGSVFCLLFPKYKSVGRSILWGLSLIQSRNTTLSIYSVLLHSFV